VPERAAERGLHREGLVEVEALKIEAREAQRPGQHGQQNDCPHHGIGLSSSTVYLITAE
jgi:hypothetical protein